MARKGPTKGSRVPVQLPFGEDRKPSADGKKPGKNRIVLIKENIAKFFGWKPLTQYDLENISIRTAAGEKATKRIKRVGSFRRESVRLILDKPKKIGSSPGLYKTISVPLGSGCTVTDAVRWFQQNGKSKGVIGLISQDGQRYQWDFSKTTPR